MSKIDEIDTGVAPVEKHKQRRSFLKRSAAGVVITSLPAQSVWGSVCSVSGAMSGNLSGIQRHSNCDKPTLPLGRSPGTWKNFVQNNSEKVHAVFRNGEVPNSSGKLHNKVVANADMIRSCYVKGVEDVAKRKSMSINNELIDANFKLNLYDALTSSGGIDFNIAAVWMNVYFGLYSPTYVASEEAADKVVEQLLSYMSIQVANNTLPVIKDAFYNFGKGSTAYKFNSCHYLPFEPV